eukprot:TRINITY_DN22144_c0_g2_i1.p1 TRINITY_DN22144_c0_g2~~TRINITY_DN22144_c0_g2_i1.p1  ORF type:complete len:473 (+),score=119.31 TRINITY_DN22144_c0_g2_i1:59-1420(+)
MPTLDAADLEHEQPEASGTSPRTPRLPPVGAVVYFVIDAKKLKGRVAFVGETEFAPGIWIGITLDSPHGKHDGKIKDKRYFSCQPLHGLFIRARNIVQVLRNSQLVHADLPGPLDELSVSNRNSSEETHEFTNRGMAHLGETPVVQEHESEHTVQIGLSEQQRVLEEQLAAALQHAESEAVVASQHAAQLSICEEQHAQAACRAALNLAACRNEATELTAKLAMVSDGNLRLASEIEHAKEVARSTNQRSAALQDSLREAETLARCRKQPSDTFRKEAASLRSELHAEEMQRQRQLKDINRLKLSVQKERDMYTALQRDYSDAMQLAADARAEFARQRQGALEQAREVEAADADNSEKEEALRLELRRLREALKEEEMKHAAQQHKDELQESASNAGFSETASNYIQSVIQQFLCCKRLQPEPSWHRSVEKGCLDEKASLSAEPLPEPDSQLQ